MADLEARKQAIKNASALVTSGSVWLRRAADARQQKATPTKPASPPPPKKQD